MHHVRIALDDHLVRHPHGAGLRDTTRVIAAQVDQHQMLGDFLGVGEQVLLQREVFLGGLAPAPSAGDGTDGDQPLLQPHQDFRRGTDDMEIAKVQLEHVRRRVEAAQGAI